MRANTGRGCCLGLASNPRLDITGIVPVPCTSDLDLEVWIWGFEPSAILVQGCVLRSELR